MYSKSSRSNSQRIAARAQRAGGHGQSMVEFALLLPLLMMLVLGIIEGGFVLRNYNGLVAVTWMGARFALDGGSNADVVAVIQSNASGLAVTDASRTNIYVVRGKTNSSGSITSANWSAVKAYGTSGPAQPGITMAAVEQRLKNGGTGAAVDGTLTASTYANVDFVVVEMTYQHRSVTGSGVFPVNLNMGSDAVVQQVFVP